MAYVILIYNNSSEPDGYIGMDDNYNFTKVQELKDATFFSKMRDAVIVKNICFPNSPRNVCTIITREVDK